MVSSKKALVKVLGQGELSKALTVHAHKFSKSAQEKIEKAGGKDTSRVSASCQLKRNELLAAEMLRLAVDSVQ